MMSSDERTAIEKIPTAEIIPAQGVGGYPAGPYADTFIDDYVGGIPRQGGAAALAELWRAIRKRKLMIAAIVLVVTVAAMAQVSRIRNTYSASVLLEVKKDSGGLLAGGGDADPDNTVSINTKMLMFQSRPLLEDVVTKLGLDHEEKFLDVSSRRSWRDVLKSWLPTTKQDLASNLNARAPKSAVRSLSPGTDQTGQESADSGSPSPLFPGFPESDPRLDPYVAVIQRGLEVNHPRDTQALKITYTHTHPSFAAEVANGVAQVFMRQNYDNKLNKFHHTSDWLQRSTSDLKAKVAQAEQALADYSRDHNMLPTQGQTLTSDKLVRLHEQVMRADVDYLLKKSLYEEVDKGHLDNLPDAFSDPKINEQQKRINDLSLSAAQLSVSFGPEHPKVVEVQQAMKVLRDQLTASKDALRENLKADYDRASRDKESLTAALEQAKSEAAQFDQSSIQYNILKQDATTARALYDDFLRKTKQADLEAAQQQSNILLIQPAQVPKSADGPSYGLAVLMAFFGSLGGAVGIAFLLEHFDKSIKDVSDVNRYLQLPTLGIIPAIAYRQRRRLRSGLRSSGNPTLISGNGAGDRYVNAPGASSTALLTTGAANAEPDVAEGKFVSSTTLPIVAEAYRALRTSVLLSTVGGPPKTLLFASGAPGEGKTTTVVNTAISFSQLGGSVLIIDADLRKPSSRDPHEKGLSTYLSGSVDIDAAIKKLHIPGVSILPRGPIPPNPAELISSERMKYLITTLSARYDHLLIDSPPLLYATDSVVLATLVDGVILVVRAGKSSRDAVYQTRTVLNSVGAKIFGIVLNAIDFRRMSNHDIAYYPYGSEYKSGDVEGASDILRQ
ncbi:MAG TPA: polysaccharide biosynthesis tyrosine autokinase [Blastocatellia bacterium]|nr:polysaccharide biosynthesis tyrosine autokinase [Blastocatellia bacterium]